MGYIVNSAGVTPALAQTNFVEYTDSTGQNDSSKQKKPKNIDYSIDSNHGIDKNNVSQNASNLYIRQDPSILLDNDAVQRQSQIERFMNSK